ncbi:MAG: hypothetical protein WC327_03705 [Candidatus Cloacimonadia bacterium]|jgi:YbbR domain-containing protein
MKQVVLRLVVLLIVLATWMSQSFFKTHRTEVDFPLAFTHLTDEMLIKGPNTESVPVIIEGKGLDIVRFKRRKDFKVSIDLKDYEIGENIVTVTESDIYLENQEARGLLKFYLNRKIYFSVDLTEKVTLPVKLRFLTLDDENLYRQKTAYVRPSSVDIVGSSDVIRKLHEITTTPLTASLIGSKSKLINIELEIPEGVTSIKPDAVEVILESHGMITKTVPFINIGYPSEIVSSIIPPTVTVKVEGLTGNIQRLNTSSITANIVLDNDEENDYAQISITTPVGINVLEYTPKRVQIINK